MTKSIEELATEYVIMSNGKSPTDMNDAEIMATHDFLRDEVEPLKIGLIEFNKHVQQAKASLALLLPSS